MNDKIEIEAIYTILNRSEKDGVLRIAGNLKTLNSLKGRRLVIPKDFEEDKKKK